MNYNTKLKLISWNVRGLNERNKRLAVRQTLLLEKPDLVCIQETKLASLDNRKLLEICGFRLSQHEELPATGTRGGVLVAWTSSKFTLVSAIIRTYSVNVLLTNNIDGKKFWFSGIYGPSNSVGRSAFKEELISIKPTDDTPWLLGGDLNFTLELQDRTSNTTAEWRNSMDFAALISTLGLINTPLHGRRFTWSNERDQPHMARLDRFLVSDEWNQLYPNSTQTVLPNTSSDHCPIVYTANTRYRKSRFFRFENCWLRFKEYNDMIVQTWQSIAIAQTPTQLHNKLTTLQQKTKEWAKNRITTIKTQIRICREYLGWIDQVKERRQTTQLEKFIVAKIKKRYTDLSTLEEDIWRQRARTKWEMQGDRGTRFFHNIASAAKKTNTVMQIEHQGTVCMDQKSKAHLFFQFYTDLIGQTSTQVPNIHWDNLYPSNDNARELQVLQEDITLEEVKTTIKQWPKNKSPGPDGFSGEFYNHFIDILALDLCKVFQQVTRQGISLQPLNTSYIVLLPKKESPATVQDYRPISLLHGIQKIFSKILANRLQHRLPELLHKAQTGFMKNRYICESFIYAQHVLHITRKRNLPIALFKADFTKAFDTVSWDFIMAVMRAHGFPEKWLSWIQQIILVGTSQIMINGLLGKKIMLRRGVRQGDPLSPLLFILAIDFLARYVQKLTDIGALRLPFRGMSPCLLYADDAMFFIKPEVQQLQALQIVLTAFKQISGLSVNLAKSELMVSIGSQASQQELANVLGCRLATLPFTYLGLPLSNKKLPKSAYLPLIQRMNKRLGGWAAKHLTIAGRIVLINSVLSSLPTYFMSCLKLPVWVIKDIDKIRRTFLWHGTIPQAHSKINLANWKLSCTPKDFGGLGIMDLTVFNQALLIKWFWQWRKPEMTLCKSLFQQHIATNGLPDSPIFSAISNSLSYCQFFFSHKIGDGKRIQLWNDNWDGQLLSTILPDLYTHAIDTQITLYEVSQVSNLTALFRPISSDTANLELVKLQNSLSGMVLNPITKDDISWKWKESGPYKVREGYKAMKDAPIILNRAQRIWKLQAPPRMKVFGWLALNNKLLTIDNLNKRGWPLVNRCVLCKIQGESIRHMLDECTFSKSVYAALAHTIPAKIPTLTYTTPPTEMLTSATVPKTQRETMLITQFIIWRERCARTFTEVSKDAQDIKEEVLWQLQFQKSEAMQTGGRS